MHVYQFLEISLSDVVSVYDEPEIVVNSKIYADTDDICGLVIKIVDTYDFRSNKSMQGLADAVMDHVRTYEMQRTLDTPEHVSFYESMHAQNFMDGVNSPWKYQNPIGVRDIMITASRLGIVPAKKMLKYLLTDEEPWRYELNHTEVY